MSETPQAEAYDCVSTRTIKVGGADVRLTLMRVFNLLKEGFQRGGQDAVVTVTITTHVPRRRLAA
jgi:hypothetical protein